MRLLTTFLKLIGTLWLSWFCICRSKFFLHYFDRQFLIFNCFYYIFIHQLIPYIYKILYHYRVAESPDCKMPIMSLAKIFGPTIVGYSLPEPAEMNVLKDTADQVKVCAHTYFFLIGINC